MSEERPRDGEGGVLYVVATPIGNLGDVTIRALEVLRSVPLIAAEDTRVSRRLLDRHGIDTPVTSFHAHSGTARLETLLAHLRGGADLAIVTDAGTPGISDPGADLARAWAGAGGRVVPVPGASAVLTIVAATGIAGPRWSFEGFLPRAGRERRERLAAIGADPRGTILYESPGRTRATLRDLASACGPDRVAAVGRELTKLHEQIVVGTLGELVRAVEDGTIPARGEVAILVGMTETPTMPASGSASVDPLVAALAEVDRRVADGVARGDAARRVSKATGLPRRSLYRPDGGGR